MWVDGTNVDVMFGVMVFGGVVAEVFEARVPSHIEMAFFCLIAGMEMSHFHWAGAMFFDGFVGYSDGGGVVAVDWGGRLGVAHFLESQAQCSSFFDV